MAIVFDEVVGSVVGERGAQTQGVANPDATDRAPPLDVRVREMEREFRIREERRARLLAD